MAAKKRHAKQNADAYAYEPEQAQDHSEAPASPVFATLTKNRKISEDGRDRERQCSKQSAVAAVLAAVLVAAVLVVPAVYHEYIHWAQLPSSHQKQTTTQSFQSDSVLQGGQSAEKNDPSPAHRHAPPPRPLASAFEGEYRDSARELYEARTPVMPVHQDPEDCASAECVEGMGVLGLEEEEEAFDELIGMLEREGHGQVVASQPRHTTRQETKSGASRRKKKKSKKNKKVRNKRTKKTKKNGTKKKRGKKKNKDNKLKNKDKTSKKNKKNRQQATAYTMGGTDGTDDTGAMGDHDYDTDYDTDVDMGVGLVDGVDASDALSTPSGASLASSEPSSREKRLHRHLLPSDLDTLRVFANWTNTTLKEALPHSDARPQIVAEGAITWPPPLSRDTEFSVLPGLVRPSEIEAMFDHIHEADQDFQAECVLPLRAAGLCACVCVCPVSTACTSTSTPCFIRCVCARARVCVCVCVCVCIHRRPFCIRCKTNCVAVPCTATKPCACWFVGRQRSCSADTVDAMPAREYYVHRGDGEIRNHALHRVLEPIQKRMTAYVRHRYPAVCNRGGGRACTPCYSLIRRYLPEERQTHAMHRDGQALVTAVVSLNDYGRDYSGGLYVAVRDGTTSNACSLWLPCPLDGKAVCPSLADWLASRGLTGLETRLAPTPDRLFCAALVQTFSLRHLPGLARFAFSLHRPASTVLYPA